MEIKTKKRKKKKNFRLIIKLEIFDIYFYIYFYIYLYKILSDLNLFISIIYMNKGYKCYQVAFDFNI